MGQGYVILYKGDREGLSTKMNSEQRPEVENSKPPHSKCKKSPR